MKNVFADSAPSSSPTSSSTAESRGRGLPAATSSISSSIAYILALQSTIEVRTLERSARGACAAATCAVSIGTFAGRPRCGAAGAAWSGIKSSTSIAYKRFKASLQSNKKHWNRYQRRGGPRGSEKVQLSPETHNCKRRNSTSCQSSLCGALNSRSSRF